MAGMVNLKQQEEKENHSNKMQIKLFNNWLSKLYLIRQMQKVKIQSKVSNKHKDKLKNNLRILKIQLLYKEKIKT